MNPQITQIMRQSPIDPERSRAMEGEMKIPEPVKKN